MKRISTYKMFENKSDILSFVDECLVDLIHDGMIVNKRPKLDNKYLDINIRYDNDEVFDTDKVKESLLFLISMMSEKDWDIVRVNYRKDYRWNILYTLKSLILKNNIFDDNIENIKSISLEFDLNDYKYKFK